MFQIQEYYIQIDPKYILNYCDYFVFFLFVCLFAFVLFVKYNKIPQIEVKYFLNHSNSF